MNRYVSMAVLLALIVLLGSTFYRVISPFVLPMFLAAVMAVICQPMQEYFLKKTGQRTVWAAALTTSAITSIIVCPLVIATFVAATNLYDIADQQVGGDWNRGLEVLWRRCAMPLLEWASRYVPGGLSDERLVELEMEFISNIRATAAQLAGTTFSIASSTVGMFVSLAIAAGAFLTALYYFLADGRSILTAVEELIPLPVDYQRHLGDRFACVVRAVVIATFAAAFAQGLATAIALQVAGMGHFFIFLVIASIISLIPLAGAWMVWGPCAVWLALQGQWWAAIGLTVWGVAVVAMLDSTVKMYVLQSEAELHPLIAFISVIGALRVMGLWGIFIGPIVASCLFALIQILNTELKELARERDAANALTTGTPPVTVATATVTTATAQVPSGTNPSPAASSPTVGRPVRKRRR
jgi:predicted PurR-regulated permease PerM